MGKSFYSAPLEIMEPVHIDGDRSITGMVTAIQFRGTHALVEVSWFHSGEPKAAWLEPWRVTSAGEAPTLDMRRQFAEEPF